MPKYIYRKNIKNDFFNVFLVITTYILGKFH